MYSITIFGTNDLIVASNNLVLESAVTGGTYESVDFNAYEVNDERNLVTDSYTVINDITFNDRLFRGSFNIVSERLNLADYKSLENDLFSILQYEYLYLKVENYEITSAPTGYLIAIEIVGYSIEKNGGRKWITLNLHKKELD